MRSANISERELNQIKAHVYLASNGIRSERKAHKKHVKLQLVLILVLAMIGLYSVAQWHNTSDQLGQTQEQLRYESGQKISFEEWYNTHCIGAKADPNVCAGVK